ncbi:hypothetical protein DACRYDRAFT_45962 [Dacryopinax primogenitus]|uniref:CipC-like antibiotic response protein n=1 Tax=Dacryopinax primogenitus (strain DJM 731) TaxID=1858805 RepID=M5GGD1_DACPD|nr:uncharacterized protein DACRYDRAFT_45962 [Dacryopinax primogenitus]EJU05278.1 hypothetical protein DACRYDRAFT_45962 [Dacryopinax primogenitus]
MQQAEQLHGQMYAYQGYVQPEHKASWTHEAIAAAAGFAAMKAWESHLRATGQQPTHETMKEILAAIAAAEVDRLAETKGLDFIDRERAKHQAVAQAHAFANERYRGGTGAEYAQQWGGPAQEYQWNGGYGQYQGWHQQYQQGPWGGYGGGGYGPPGGGYGPPGGGYGPPGGGYGPPGGGNGPPPGEWEGGERHHHHHHHRENW